MFFISNRVMDEIYTRLREVEKTVDVNYEHNTSLENMFKKHDEQEMIKYDKIQKRLDDLYKMLYIALGGFIFLESLHKFGLISF